MLGVIHLRIYARSVHRWNLQIGDIFLPLYGSIFIYFYAANCGKNYIGQGCCSNRAAWRQTVNFTARTGVVTCNWTPAAVVTQKPWRNAEQSVDWHQFLVTYVLPLIIYHPLKVTVRRRYFLLMSTCLLDDIDWLLELRKFVFPDKGCVTPPTAKSWLSVVRCVRQQSVYFVKCFITNNTKKQSRNDNTVVKHTQNIQILKALLQSKFRTHEEPSIV